MALVERTDRHRHMEVLQVCETYSALRIMDIFSWLEWHAMEPRPDVDKNAQVMRLIASVQYEGDEAERWNARDSNSEGQRWSE